MTKRELLKLIVYNIEELGIELRKADLEGAPAVISPYYNIGVYDAKRVTPFNFAHEMIHAKYHDESRICDFDIHNPCEARANKEAIRWLWEIFTECGGSSAYFTNFIAITGCPTDQSWYIVKYYYPEGETA